MVAMRVGNAHRREIAQWQLRAQQPVLRALAAIDQHPSRARHALHRERADVALARGHFG
jgi:hypothetical protein